MVSTKKTTNLLYPYNTLFFFELHSRWYWLKIQKNKYLSSFALIRKFNSLEGGNWVKFLLNIRIFVEFSTHS